MTTLSEDSFSTDSFDSDSFDVASTTRVVEGSKLISSTDMLKHHWNRMRIQDDELLTIVARLVANGEL